MVRRSRSRSRSRSHRSRSRHHGCATASTSARCGTGQARNARGRPRPWRRWCRTAPPSRRRRRGLLGRRGWRATLAQARRQGWACCRPAAPTRGAQRAPCSARRRVRMPRRASALTRERLWRRRLGWLARRVGRRRRGGGTQAAVVATRRCSRRHRHRRRRPRLPPCVSTHATSWLLAPARARAAALRDQLAEAAARRSTARAHLSAIIARRTQLNAAVRHGPRTPLASRSRPRSGAVAPPRGGAGAVPRRPRGAPRAWRRAMCRGAWTRSCAGATSGVRSCCAASAHGLRPAARCCRPRRRGRRGLRRGWRGGRAPART